jgi:hypothetical protein
MKTGLLFVIIALFTASAWAHTVYTGYSGAPARQTCASSCHGGTGGAVTAHGFPASYIPGQTYTVTVSGPGTVIVNFNASCRMGTGATNAGVIAAGTSTTVYNVSGETNGVHFTSGNVTSGTFLWTAPAAGTGTVRLYLGALETSHNGPNTVLVLVANEAPPPPGVATSPSPTDAATGVALNSSLLWTAGNLATSHDVYFGTGNPPVFIGNQAGTTYTLAGLVGSMTYFWRIDERNASGATPGTVWSFTTAAVAPSAPQSLVIAAVDADVQLDWPPVAGATFYNVYRAANVNGDAVPANLIGSVTTAHFTDSGVLQVGGTFGYYLVTAANP